MKKFVKDAKGAFIINEGGHIISPLNSLRRKQHNITKIHCLKC